MNKGGIQSMVTPGGTPEQPQANSAVRHNDAPVDGELVEPKVRHLAPDQWQDIHTACDLLTRHWGRITTHEYEVFTQDTGQIHVVIIPTGTGS